MTLTRRSSCAGTMALIAILLLAGPSWGVVIYPDADSNYPLARPDSSVVGRWGTHASCVVIGSQYVISTSHQGAAGPIEVNGVSYTVDSNLVYRLNNDPNIDLQIAFLPGANFTQFVRVNTDRFDYMRNWTVAIGGYGQGRGSTLYFDGDSNIPYGYSWDGSDNTTLRWGQNLVQGATAVNNDANRTRLLWDRFDAPGSANFVPNEAALGNYDSGSGWFVKDANGQWLVVGLVWGSDHALSGETWFLDPNNPGAGGERNYAVRLSQYAGWINSVVPEPATLALLGLGAVALIRRRRSRRI